MAGDGSNLIVGTLAAIGSGAFGGGSALLYSRNFGTFSWTSPTSITGTNNVISQLETDTSVWFARNGNSFMFTSPSNERLNGAAWIFATGPTGWTQQGPKIVHDQPRLRLRNPLSSDADDSVAISSDGSTLALSYRRSSPGNASVVVYTKVSGTWTIQNTLTSLNSAGGLRSAVTLSGNGNVLALGLPGDNNQTTGRVYIYKRSGGVYTLDQQITGSSGNRYGGALALSEDGLSLAIGTDPSANMLAPWKSNGSTFFMDMAITGAENVFGSAVAISSDGNVIATSSPFRSANAGEVYVYNRVGTSSTWAKVFTTQPLVNTTSTLRFGSSLSLSGDGRILAIGTDPSSVLSLFGMVFIYENYGCWKLSTRLSGLGQLRQNTTTSSTYGSEVSLSKDGMILAVGSYLDQAYDSRSPGAVWTYVRNPLTRMYYEDKKFQGSFLTSDITTASFGRKISLSRDGSVMLVGAGGKNGLPHVFTR